MHIQSCLLLILGISLTKETTKVSPTWLPNHDPASVPVQTDPEFTSSCLTSHILLCPHLTGRRRPDQKEQPILTCVGVLTLLIRWEPRRHNLHSWGLLRFSIRLPHFPACPRCVPPNCLSLRALLCNSLTGMLKAIIPSLRDFSS